MLEAPPGAGKTTRVPPALLSFDPRDVLVLEPRRLAARLAARFVAGERGESSVGLSAIRFASKRSQARKRGFASSPKAC